MRVQYLIVSIKTNDLWEEISQTRDPSWHGAAVWKEMGRILIPQKYYLIDRIIWDVSYDREDNFL